MLRPEQAQVCRLHTCAIAVRRELARSSALWRCFARAIYSCLTALRCKRSQAGKRCASQVGMHRRHEKKAAINLPHPGGLVSALDAPETVLRSTLSVQHCDCVHGPVVRIALLQFGWVGSMGGQGDCAGRLPVALGGPRWRNQQGGGYGRFLRLHAHFNLPACASHVSSMGNSREETTVSQPWQMRRSA